MATLMVNRKAAVELFTELGIKTAGKWNAKRMAAKLGKLDEMVDKDTEVGTAEAEQLMVDVLAAIKDEYDFEIVGDDEKPETPPKTTGGKKTAKKKAANPKKEAEDGDGETETEEPKKPAGPPGVREAMTRPYCAGVVVAQHGGLEAGATEEMAREVDAMFGKENYEMSLWCVKNAWHSIRGYLDETGK